MADTTVTLHGEQIEVAAGGQVWMLNRDRLETAWLAWLEHRDRLSLAVDLRDRHGFAHDAIPYAIAADLLHRANISI